MKTLKITTLLFILLLSSCSKDDDNLNIKDKDIESNNFKNTGYFSFRNKKVETNYGYIVNIIDKRGSFEIALFSNTPITKTNFIKNKDGYFDELVFKEETMGYCQIDYEEKFGKKRPSSAFFAYDYVKKDEYYEYSDHVFGYHNPPKVEEIIEDEITKLTFTFVINTDTGTQIYGEYKYKGDDLEKLTIDLTK